MYNLILMRGLFRVFIGGIHATQVEGQNGVFSHAFMPGFWALI
jgi:hypothetical protein